MTATHLKPRVAIVDKYGTMCTWHLMKYKEHHLFIDGMDVEDRSVLVVAELPSCYNI